MANVFSFEKYRKERLAEQMLDKMMQDPEVQRELHDIYAFNHINRTKLFLSALFYQNHKVMKGKNLSAGFLIGFGQGELEHILGGVKSTLDAIERQYIVIDAASKSFIDCIKMLTGENYRSDGCAFNGLKSVLLNTNKVVVFKEFSKCKMKSHKDKASRIRSIIKINDDAHLNSIRPLSDLLFIDHACFLQKCWEDIGAYVKVTI